MTVAFPLGPHLLRIVLGQVEAELVSQALGFLRLLPLAFIPWLLQSAITAVLSGAGDTRTPLALNAVLWSVVLGWDYLVLLGPLAHLPLGSTGIALSRIWGRLVAILLGLGLLFSGRLVLTAPRRLLAFLPNPALLRRILRISLPACGMHALWTLSELAFYSILVRAAASSAQKSINLAAYSIAGTSAELLFGLLWSFSIVSTTLVGQSLGAGQPQEASRRARTIGAYSLVLGALASLTLLLLARPVVSLLNHTGQHAVTTVASSFLLILALIGIIEGLISALYGALIGAGDTPFLLLTTILGDVVVRLGLSALFVFVFGLGARGALWGLGFTSLLWLGLLAFRFASGRWKTITV
jgi:Na+-driven multidrug efflux pump